MICWAEKYLSLLSVRTVYSFAAMRLSLAYFPDKTFAASRLIKVEKDSPFAN